MGLEVYRGKNQANRKYELEFFREFAATLTTQFKDQRRDGVLLGHPLSTYNPNRFKPWTATVFSDSGPS